MLGHHLWFPRVRSSSCLSRFLALSLFVAALGCSDMNSAAHTDNFRFENFQEEEAMNNALYELHPRGSDFGPLLQTLREAGADCVEDDVYSEIPAGTTVEELKEKFGGLRIFSCKHVKQSLMNKSLWGVYVHIRGNGKLHELVSYIHRT